MAIDWAREWPLIQSAALAYGVDPLFIAAIRFAEGGGKGIEFGVMTRKGESYESQLRGACATVRNFTARYKDNPFTRKAGYSHDGGFRALRLIPSEAFMRAFAGQWAPVGAENDPQNLNENWLGNWWVMYSDILKNGPPRA